MAGIVDGQMAAIWQRDSWGMCCKSLMTVVSWKADNHILEARMPNATMTPTKSLSWISKRNYPSLKRAQTYVPTPDITLFRLRHQLAF